MRTLHMLVFAFRLGVSALAGFVLLPTFLAISGDVTYGAAHTVVGLARDPSRQLTQQAAHTVYMPLLFRTFTCSDVTEIPQAECAALADLGGGSLGWLNSELCGYTGDSPCGSPYISCVGGHVDMIYGHCFAYFPPHPFVSPGLTGNIPSCIGDLRYLRTLSLRYNNFTGQIPSSLAQLSQLESLDLSTNNLSGSIPPELGNLANLIRLRLSQNQLSGPIPTELGVLVNPDELDLAGNELSGTIPGALGQLVKLTDLRLSVNRLSGAAPVELGNLTQLVSLNLAANDPSLCMPLELEPFVTSLFEYWPPPGEFCQRYGSNGDAGERR